MLSFGFTSTMQRHLLTWNPRKMLAINKSRAFLPLRQSREDFSRLMAWQFFIIDIKLTTSEIHQPLVPVGQTWIMTWKSLFVHLLTTRTNSKMHIHIHRQSHTVHEQNEQKPSVTVSFCRFYQFAVSKQITQSAQYGWESTIKRCTEKELSRDSLLWSDRSHDLTAREGCQIGQRLWNYLGWHSLAFPFQNRPPGSHE